MYIFPLLLTILLYSKTACKEIHGLSGLDQKVLEKWHLEHLDISSSSKKEFKEFLETQCLVNLYKTDFLDSYLKWENVEFLKSVRNTLNIANDFTNQQYVDIASSPDHNYLFAYHEFRSNCTLRNITKMQRTHYEVDEAGKFENLLYDIAMGPLSSYGIS